MNPQQNRRNLIVAAAGFLIALLIWAIFRPQPPAPVRVTFLYSTNDVTGEHAAAFELVNDLNENVDCGFGHYQVATRSGIEPQRGDWGAPFSGTRNFVAHSTNIVTLWCPTNGGPYKLVLYCSPASKTTPQYSKSVRFRFYNMLVPWLQPSFTQHGRWCGAIYPESQPFEVKPPSKPRPLAAK
jgi:hypothetical protein